MRTTQGGVTAPHAAAIQEPAVVEAEAEAEAVAVAVAAVLDSVIATHDMSDTTQQSEQHDATKARPHVHSMCTSHA